MRIQGEKHHQAKLTQAKVNEIRAMYLDGAGSQREIAKQFGISQTTVSMIINRITWRPHEETMTTQETKLLALLDLIAGHARVGLISNELGKQVKLEQILKIASTNQLGDGITRTPAVMRETPFYTSPQKKARRIKEWARNQLGKI